MSVGDVTEREERPPYVKFETVAKNDPEASLKMGRAMSKDVDYALINPPYSKDQVRMRIDRWKDNVEQDTRNKRIPPQWKDAWFKGYELWKTGQEAPLEGTPIKDWSSITPSQIKNLLNIRILTVEDLANVNDEGLRRIGMGANDLKRKAENWLKAANDHGPLTIRVTQLETENSRLLVTVEDLIEKNKALMSQLEALKQPVQAYTQPIQEQGISVNDILDANQEKDYHQDIAPPTVVETKSLTEQFQDKFGRKPHSKMSEEKLRQKLAE